MLSLEGGSERYITVSPVVAEAKQFCNFPEELFYSRPEFRMDFADSLDVGFLKQAESVHI